MRLTEPFYLQNVDQCKFQVYKYTDNAPKIDIS